MLCLHDDDWMLIHLLSDTPTYVHLHNFSRKQESEIAYLYNLHTQQSVIVKECYLKLFIVVSV